MWVAIVFALFMLVIGWVVGVNWANRMYRSAHLNIADSLSASRRVLSRGDINRTFEMLESLENMIRKWEPPVVEDK